MGGNLGGDLLQDSLRAAKFYPHLGIFPPGDHLGLIYLVYDFGNTLGKITWEGKESPTVTGSMDGRKVLKLKVWMDVVFRSEMLCSGHSVQHLTPRLQVNKAHVPDTKALTFSLKLPLPSINCWYSQTPEQSTVERLNVKLPTSCIVSGQLYCRVCFKYLVYIIKYKVASYCRQIWYL